MTTVTKRHEMTEGEFKPMQLLRVTNIDGCYEIGSVTEKAIMIKCDDGRWGGNGFKPLWIPKSILNISGIDNRCSVSDHGTHLVTLPDWFVNKNSKLL